MTGRTEMDNRPDDGGPAFPQHDLSGYGIGPHLTRNDGMSLRDWFAGQALAGMLCNGFMPNQVGSGTYVNREQPFDYSAAAYTMADAMLAQRTKENG